jgi:hypothetical protein
VHGTVGAWRSLVAHLNGVQEVERSNRSAPTTDPRTKAAPPEGPSSGPVPISVPCQSAERLRGTSSIADATRPAMSHVQLASGDGLIRQPTDRPPESGSRAAPVRPGRPSPPQPTRPRQVGSMAPSFRDSTRFASHGMRSSGTLAQPSLVRLPSTSSHRAAAVCPRMTCSGPWRGNLLEASSGPQMRHRLPGDPPRSGRRVPRGAIWPGLTGHAALSVSWRQRAVRG